MWPIALMETETTTERTDEGSATATKTMMWPWKGTTTSRAETMAEAAVGSDVKLSAEVETSMTSRVAIIRETSGTRKGVALDEVKDTIRSMENEQWSRTPCRFGYQ